MDIEGSEWDSLTTIIADGLLDNVKQLGLESHVTNPHSVDSFSEKINTLKRLETLGFKKWYVHKNPACHKLSVIQEKVYITRCFEMVYINTNYIV